MKCVGRGYFKIKYIFKFVLSKKSSIFINPINLKLHLFQAFSSPTAAKDPFSIFSIFSSPAGHPVVQNSKYYVKNFKKNGKMQHYFWKFSEF